MNALRYIRPPAGWTLHALCEDDRIFFSDIAEDQAEACALCAVCPVASSCLRAALADVLEELPGADEYGIRAGFRPHTLRTGLRGLLRDGLLEELLEAGARLPDVVTLLEPVAPQRTVYRWAAEAA